MREDDPRFKIAAARRRRLASPMTSGRQNLHGSSRARVLTMISGPTPAASPMVIAMRGCDIGSTCNCGEMRFQSVTGR